MIRLLETLEAPGPPLDPGSVAAVEPASVDTVVLALFADTTLRKEVRRLPKTELSKVCDLTLQALAEQAGTSPPIGSIEVHRRLLAGLAGESLMVSAFLFLRSIAEAEDFFGLSCKTIMARLGAGLDAASSERALRSARADLHTPNFGLGGATPADLIRTAEGERIVLNELQTPFGLRPS